LAVSPQNKGVANTALPCLAVQRPGRRRSNELFLKDCAGFLRR
jgi:hypothetical protein